MARIQSSRSGKKPPPVKIISREINRKAEEALVKKGQPSKRWGDYSTALRGRPPSTA